MLKVYQKIIINGSSKNNIIATLGGILNNKEPVKASNDILKEAPHIKIKKQRNKPSKKVNEPNPSETKCKFMSSYSQSYTCPETHPNHLGAVFGAKSSSGIKCNGKNIKVNNAKAYPIIRNNKVVEVKLLTGGNNYIKPPKIIIKGNGKGAKAVAIMDKYNSSIKRVKLIHNGKGYTETPKVIISKPNGNTYCHLCCKLPQY